MAAHKFHDPHLARLARASRGGKKKKRATKRRKTAKRRKATVRVKVVYRYRSRPAKKRTAKRSAHRTHGAHKASKKRTRKVYRDKHGKVISAAQHRARQRFAKAAKARARASHRRK